MNLQAFKNRNGIIILACLVVIILIYSIDLFKLDNRLTGWQEFGQTPVKPAHIQYFVANTPNSIGYKEPDTGEMVTCEETVAYLQTDSQETFRCCNTGEKISCLEGNFSSEIPAPDEACASRLRSTFGIPSSLTGVKDYQAFENCSSEAGLTVVQLDNNGQILWRFLDTAQITAINSTLRCALGPLLLAVIGWIVFATLRGSTYKPIRRI